MSMGTRAGWAAGVVASFCFVLGSTGCRGVETSTVYSPPGTTTKVFIVRHAERPEGFDPPLNEEGVARAEALADELENEGITAIFVPDLIRNRQTAEPLKERTGASLRVFSQLDMANTKNLANTFVQLVLQDYAGEAVLWIGNTGPVIENVQSGNLQEIYWRFGGTEEPPIRYRDLYKVTLFDDEPPLIEMSSYGGPSSLD